MQLKAIYCFYFSFCGSRVQTQLSGVPYLGSHKGAGRVSVRAGFLLEGWSREGSASRPPQGVGRIHPLSAVRSIAMLRVCSHCGGRETLTRRALRSSVIHPTTFSPRHRPPTHGGGTTSRHEHHVVGMGRHCQFWLHACIAYPLPHAACRMLAGRGVWCGLCLCGDMNRQVGPAQSLSCHGGVDQVGCSF